MVKQKYVAIQVYPETKERFQQIEGPLGSSQNSIMEKLLDFWEEGQNQAHKYTTIQVKPETKERFMKLCEAGDSQDTALTRLLDEYDENTKLRAFYEKYKDRAELMDSMEAGGMA